MLKLWVDDLRPPPDNTWNWVKTSEQTLTVLASLVVFDGGPVRFLTGIEVSLDHDLGGEQTTRPIVLWMAEHGLWPDTISVHSQNPVGREWLEGMIERYRT